MKSKVMQHYTCAHRALDACRLLDFEKRVGQRPKGLMPAVVEQDMSEACGAAPELEPSSERCPNTGRA
jgi:hypothetical protein